ncbi:MAG: ribbon-helix-helix protein, CopG family [Erysipelotrichaceae bacterium]|nr:ribbon-helix-helix protein, CopG family [Erysipelotrichaceae bacterium]
MTISLRLSEEDTKLIKDYAKVNNMSVSDLIRQAVIEKIEDEIDLAAYNKAVEAYKKNPKTYTLDEVEKELSL